TWRALRSSGTGAPMARHACCNECAMSPVESASVPSQSKTISRNRRPPFARARSAIACGRVETRDELREIGRERRLHDDFAAFDRMGKTDPVRVQEHALQSLLRQNLVPREIAVLVVSRERIAQMREVNPDLMRASGLELRFEQRERRIEIRP